MNSKLLPRMLALVVVVFLGVYYIAIDVLQYRVTSQPFPVTVLMSSAGGLYSGADVTYRGVQVGKVTALDLGPTEVSVKLGINAGSRFPTTVRSGSRNFRPWASSTSTSNRGVHPDHACTRDPSSLNAGLFSPHKSVRRWSTSTRCSGASTRKT